MKRLIGLLLIFILIFNIGYAVDSPHQDQLDPSLIPIIEDICATYTIVINYIDINGEPVAPRFITTLNVGDIYNILSPEIQNYIATIQNIVGVMPKRNIEYSVIYLSPGSSQKIYVINDLEVPLGLGFSIMNLGVCIE